MARIDRYSILPGVWAVPCFVSASTAAIWPPVRPSLLRPLWHFDLCPVLRHTNIINGNWLNRNKELRWSTMKSLETNPLRSFGFGVNHRHVNLLISRDSGLSRLHFAPTRFAKGTNGGYTDTMAGARLTPANSVGNHIHARVSRAAMEGTRKLRRRKNVSANGFPLFSFSSAILT